MQERTPRIQQTRTHSDGERATLGRARARPAAGPAPRAPASGLGDAPGVEESVPSTAAGVRRRDRSRPVHATWGVAHESECCRPGGSLARRRARQLHCSAPDSASVSAPPERCT